MRNIILNIFLLLPVTAVCQNKDTHYNEINDPVFRVTLTFPMLPLQEGTTVLACYEQAVKKPFTFVLKAGPSISKRKFGPAEDPYQWSVDAFASTELRYYYNLVHRIKKDKPTRNYSAGYLSVQSYIVSNPVILINQEKEEAIGGSIGIFLNLGYQKQYQHLYFNAFFGVRLAGKDLSKPANNTDPASVHGGIGIGYVF